MRRPRVLLAEDHNDVAKSLARLLRDDFDVVGIVGDGQALVEAARQLLPEAIVADIAMPRIGGLDALRQLRSDGNRVPILFLTACPDAQLADEAIRAGASGFMLKHAAGEELITAIREVLQGRVYLAL
jgi:DNA-binding NarL/FixJ family response regulator